MKKALIIITGFIGVCVILDMFLGVFDKSKEIAKINVNGECLTSVAKDKTAITLRVTTLDKNPAVSMKQATEKIAEITDFLKDLDVKTQTIEFESYEKSEWNNETHKSDVLGTETRIAIEVSSDKPELIEDVLNKFAGQPDVYTENLRMFTSPATLKPALDKCLGIAVIDARERANALVRADNRRVGKLLSLSYNNVSYNDRPYNAVPMLAMAKSAVMDTEINAGGALVSKDTDVTVTVSATFEIK